METSAAAKLSAPQQCTGSAIDSEPVSTEKDQVPPGRSGNFRGRVSRTLSMLLPNTERPEADTRRHSGCFSSVFNRAVTRNSLVQTRMSPDSPPGNKSGNETTATNDINSNFIQIWSPVKKTMITIPSYDSDQKAYSLAMKAYILDIKQLYDLSKGKSVEGIDTSRIDLSDIKGKKSWDLQSAQRMREEWAFELTGHISSEHAS